MPANLFFFGGIAEVADSVVYLEAMAMIEFPLLRGAQKVAELTEDWRRSYESESSFTLPERLYARSNRSGASPRMSDGEHVQFIAAKIEDGLSGGDGIRTIRRRGLAAQGKAEPLSPTPERRPPA